MNNIQNRYELMRTAEQLINGVNKLKPIVINYYKNSEYDYEVEIENLLHILNQRIEEIQNYIAK